LEQTGDYEDALRQSEAALLILQLIGGPYLEADTLIRTGVIRRQLGDHAKAIEMTLKGLDIFRAIGSRIGQADALNYLGAALSAIGEYEKAQATLRQAHALYASVNSRHGETETLNQLGHVQLTIGEVEAARGCHLRALEASREIGIPMEEARSLEGLAICHWLAGENTTALVRFGQAQSIYRRIGAANLNSLTAELARLADSQLGERR